ncbi:MAG: Ig-like domain-containing protein [Pseudomonas sp.]|uniref:Ig-like domain-containing protein n=1 Tax=Pseudomonas sp. TaxID=306 RepID=UPI003399D38D
MKLLDLFRGKGETQVRVPPVQRRTPLALSLEPRMMFDGAVAATVAEQAPADPVQEAPAPSAVAGEPRQEVVFVDGQVQNLQQVLAALPATADREVVVLDPARDGLQQMADYLQGRTGLDAVHLLSHGKEGAVRVGNGWLDAQRLDQHAQALADIGAALTADGDILLYGCNAGEADAGQALIEGMVRLTGADVAASSDATGAARLGGDWVLERQTGAIDGPALVLDVEALLAAPVSETFDGVAVDGNGYSFGDSPRVINGWTVSLLDGADQNVAVDGIDNTLDVSANAGDSIILDGGSDQALRINGFYGLVSAVQFSATTQEEFALESFVVSNEGLMLPDLQIVGYRDGVEVASYAFTAPQDSTVTAVDPSLDGDLDWQFIDAFRIVQADASADIQFWIDDIAIAVAVAPNVAPVVNNLNGDAANFSEGAGPVLLDVGGDATVLDSDSADFNGGTVLVAISANQASGEDLLAIRNQGVAVGQIGVSGSAVSYGGVQIGTFSGGANGSDLSVSLNGSATPAAVAALLRNLTYDNGAATNPSLATRTVGISVTDGDGGTSNLSAVTVGITGINDAPVVSLGSSLAYTEGASATVIDATISLSDADDLQMVGATASISSGFSSGDILGFTNQNGITGSFNTGTGALTLSGTATTAQYEAALRSVTFASTADDPTASSATRGVTWVVTDADASGSGARSSFAETSQIDLTAINDRPVLGAGGTLAYTENGGPSALDTLLTVTDADDSQLGGAAVSISAGYTTGDLLGFTSQNGITGSFNAGTGVLTLAGSASVAQYQAALRSVTFSSGSSDPAGGSASRTISWTVTDANSDGAGAQTSQAATSTINITAINDAPQVSVPAFIGVTEDVASAIIGISFSDIDAGSTSVTATLAVASGSLAASSAGGVTIGGSGSTLTLTGSLVDINAFIAASGVSYTTAGNASAAVILTASITDGGHSGTGGALTDSDTTTLQVSAVNDTPVVSVPASISVDEDVSTALTGISFADLDAAGGAMTATFGVASGTLAATSGSGVLVGGGGPALTLTGSLADLNAFIAASGVSFTTASNATGNVTLTVALDDGGNTGSGGNLTDSETVTLMASAVNDNPVNGVPGSQAVDQDAVLVFSSGNGNRISVGDVDAGGGTVRVTLTGSNGLVTLSGTSGLGFLVGSGSADAGMTFEGSLADINAALNGLFFTPTPGYNGAASLQVVSDDLGLSGSGGAQTDSDTISIAVAALNPLVIAVQSGSPDGLYREGDVIALTVIFDQAVIVSGGSPTLLLETGLIDRAASYVSGSGSDTLTFSYRVQAGDSSADLDYQSMAALSLNGATIRSATSSDAFLTLPPTGGADSIAGQHAIVVNTLRPTATLVVADSALAIGETSVVTITFSEAVSGFDNGDLTVQNGTLSDVVSTDGGITWTAVLTPGPGIADSSNRVALNVAGVQNGAGNAGIGSTDSNSYAIDTLRPTASIVVADNLLMPGEASLVTITFSEAVTGFDHADLTVENGTLSAVSSSDGGITWTVLLTPTVNTTDALNVIALANVGVTDLAGNVGQGATSSNVYAIDTVPVIEPPLPPVEPPVPPVEPPVPPVEPPVPPVEPPVPPVEPPVPPLEPPLPPAVDPQFQITDGLPPAPDAALPPAPAFSLAPVNPVSPLAPPGLFDNLGLGSGIPALGSIFIHNGALAPSFLAQVFASSDSGGDGSGVGFLGFGGGDAGVFGSSSLSSVFGKDVPQYDTSLNAFGGKQRGGSEVRDGLRGIFSAPSLGQQLQDLPASRPEGDLAWALAQLAWQTRQDETQEN